MARNSDRDPYVDGETGVLKNKLGIRDQATLEGAEADLVSIRSQELWLSPLEGKFDLTHLKRFTGTYFTMFTCGQVNYGP